MAERNNPRSSDGLAQKTKPRDTSFERLRGIQRPTTAPVGRRDRTRPAGRNAQAGSPQPLPDTRQPSFPRTLEQPRLATPSPVARESAIDRVRRGENAPTKSPLNYTGSKTGKDKSPGPPVGGNSKQGTGKQSPLNRLGGWFGRHKKASIAALSGGLVGGTMMIFGGTMSGPAHILHIAERIGDIVDTIQDMTKLSRLTRVVSKATNAASSAIRNTRVGRAASVMSRGFEKKLAKAGIDLVKDSAGKTIGLAFKEGAASAKSLEKLKKAGKFADMATDGGKTVLKFADGAGTADKMKSFSSALKTATKARTGNLAMSLISKNQKLASMVSRIQGVISKLQDFHPIKSLTGKIKNGGKTLFKKMAAKFTKKKALQITQKAGTSVAAKFAKKAITKVEKVLAAVGKAAVKGLMTAIKVIPIVGTILGFIGGFVFEIWMRRASAVSFEANLNIAASKAGEIQATASQIKSGNFPTETEKYEANELAAGDTVEDGSPMDELNIFSDNNIYTEVEYINEPPEGSVCRSEYDRMPEPLDEDETDTDKINEHAEETEAVITAVKECLAVAGESDEIVGIQVYDFEKSAMVKHEDGDPAFQTHDSIINDDPTGSVPPELLPETYDDALAGDVLNSLIASVAIVSPDMFDDDDDTLNTLTANPAQIGSISMAGGRALSNTKMLAAGGHAVAEGSPEDVEIQTARRQYIEDEFNAKPLLARLFDVSDYKSAVVTLARQSGWDMSNSSFGTQLKNVAKTFAQLPVLIASSLSKLSWAGATVTAGSDFYGFGTVGYTENELNGLPDFDVAADGVVKFHGEISSDLKHAGIQEITADGRIIYNEDTDAKDLDVTANQAKALGSETAHPVTLCDDGSFVWKDDDPDGTLAASCWSGTMVYGDKERVGSDGKVEFDQDGDPVMEDDQNIVIAGPTSYTVDQMVRAYLLDYPTIMASAADDFFDLCDDIEDATAKSQCEADKAESGDFIGEAMQDMGVSTGSSTSSSNSEFNADTIQEDFQATECGNVSGRQCTAAPHWFVDKYTSLTYGNGNGGQVADQLAATNNISTSTTPIAPAVFSSCTYNTAAVCGSGADCCANGKYGHTGVIIKVEGDTATTLETWKGLSGQSPCSSVRTFKISAQTDMVYVNLGEYLK